MAQLHAFIGTINQRICFVVLMSLVLIWLFKGAGDGLKSSNILTLPPPLVPSTIDLSSPVSPFVVYPLARVCAESKPVPGLVFICDNNSGGPGNIRNYILTCLRYAIEAGATSLILPRIRTRSASDLANIHLGHQEFGYMFDEAHFLSGLTASCPQIRVYSKLEEVPHVLEKVEREGLYDVDKMIERITPRQHFGSRGGCDARDLNRHTDRFGQRFQDWLDSSAVELGLAKISVDSPRLMRLNWGVLWDWEVLRDGPEFVATFGGLLRFKDDLLDLGHKVIEATRKEARQDPKEKGHQNDKFLGVHLRTEEDALKEWPSYDTQIEGYTAEAKKWGFSSGMAYLASGSESETTRFKHSVSAEMQLEVRTKYDLLEARDLERLKNLSWDQQAVVDFVVLLAADYFVGISPSSFSINVALKRHLRTGGLYTRPWRVGGAGDERSWLVGSYEKYWDDWLFMYDGMWP